MRNRLFALLLSVLAAPPVFADYSVGRLSGLSGSVMVQTPGDPDSHAASLNEVLAEGDQLATWDDARAELQFSGALVELGPDTVIALSRVSTDEIAVYVAQGSVALARLSAREPDSLLLQGPHTLAELPVPGRVRLSVWPTSQQEWLSVRFGRAEAQADQNRLMLYAGQGLQVFFTAGGQATSVSAAQAEDGLDLALLDGYGATRAALAQRGLADDWIGAGALDGAGAWTDGGGIGTLWIPAALPVGWSPYRQGHWQWNAVWGWTWVDDLPWAWLPYHYGRWLMWRGHWAWSPQGPARQFTPAVPCPPGVVPPPLPGPWQPAGRPPLAVEALHRPRAQPAAALASNSRGQPAASAAAGAPTPAPARRGTPAGPASGVALAPPAVPQITLRRWPAAESGAASGLADSRGIAEAAPAPEGPQALAVRPMLRQEPATRAFTPPEPPPPAARRGVVPEGPLRAAEGGEPVRHGFAPPEHLLRGAPPAEEHSPGRGAAPAERPRAGVSGAARPASGPTGSPPNASGGASGRPERGS